MPNVPLFRGGLIFFPIFKGINSICWKKKKMFPNSHISLESENPQGFLLLLL